MSALKIPAIVTCLMRLHNFCIDFDLRNTPSSRRRDERHIRNVASRGIHSAVMLDKSGVPQDLLGSGHHFHDEPNGRGKRPAGGGDGMTPMQQMIKQVADLDLRRPTPY